MTCPPIKPLAMSAILTVDPHSGIDLRSSTPRSVSPPGKSSRECG